MNKQELIEKVETLPDNIGLIRPHIDKKIVLGLVRQLDEPEKVKIPQFVADWIEVCKKKGDLSLGGAIQLSCPEMYEWLMDWNNQEIFARAWLDGYEVEEEPKYIVKIKGVGFMSFLNHDLQSDLWSINNGDNGKLFKTHHTRKELEDAGFGWVFDCEGIEIEEVEK